MVVVLCCRTATAKLRPHCEGEMGNCCLANGFLRKKSVPSDGGLSSANGHNQNISTVYAPNGVLPATGDMSRTELDLADEQGTRADNKFGKRTASTAKIKTDEHGIRISDVLFSTLSKSAGVSAGVDNTTADPRVRTLPTGADLGHLSKKSAKLPKYIAKFDKRVTDKYDIKALIGRGSFSRVVRVENRLTRQPYAIKMVDRVRGRDVGESELNVLRRVKHEYIIQLIEVFESTDKLYMVVELATGGELFERVISVGHFTERDAARVLGMVLEGLRYLHSVGIAHRDLKPENLLYYHPGADSKILITDFGLSAFRKTSPSAAAAGNGVAAVEYEECMMRTTCGTPEYIAPEILARHSYTGQVDLWAVGVITYILLSGTMPFDDDNRARLYRLILRAMYNYNGTHWKDISALAKDFIDRLLVVDPNDRLTAAEALVHPWIRAPTSHMDAGSAAKDLHRTVSKNLLERASLRSSDKSYRSQRSSRSGLSLRSERRRVAVEEIDELHRDPEVRAELSSLASHRTDRSGRSNVTDRTNRTDRTSRTDRTNRTDRTSRSVR